MDRECPPLEYARETQVRSKSLTLLSRIALALSIAALAAGAVLLLYGPSLRNSGFAEVLLGAASLGVLLSIATCISGIVRGHTSAIIMSFFGALSSTIGGAITFLALVVQGLSRC